MSSKYTHEQISEHYDSYSFDEALKRQSEIDHFCPNCHIGLNSSEKQIKFCKNCEHSWS